LIDTLDAATKLLKPYRGWIATMEIIKNTIIAFTGAIVFWVAVGIGLANQKILAPALTILIWLFIVIVCSYFIKMLYNRKYMES